MKKNKLLLTLSSIALSFGAASVLVSCEDKPDADSTSQEASVSVTLQVAATPTKTSYKVGEALDFAGLVVKKVTTTNGVSDGGVTVSNADLSFSTNDGTVLSVAGTLTITISYPDDEDVTDASFNVAVADKETFTISFENDDGTVLDTQAVKENASVSYGGETPTKESDENYGYTFAGWYIKGDTSKTLVNLNGYIATGNVTFVAKYTSWDANSGDGFLNYSYSDSYGENGGYYVTGFDSSAAKSTVLQIPNTFNGKPIVGIADKAFYQKTTIEKVILGTSIEYIGSNAFYGCKALLGVSATEDDYVEGTLEVPTSVKEMGRECFRSLTSIKKIIVGSQNLTEVPYAAFRGCSAVNSLTIKEGVQKVDTYAFYDVAAGDLVMPDSLTEFGVAFSTSGVKKVSDGPFSSKVITLKLGKGMTAEAFEESQINYKLTSLINYSVDEDNPNFTVVDGVLYNKDMTTLLAYPWAKTLKDANGNVTKEFTVPSTVTRIANGAFGSASINTNITKFAMPSGLKEIGQNSFSYRQGALFDFGESEVEKIELGAFYGCKMGTSKPTDTTYEWVMPNSVKEMGDYAFASETSLASFTFGTGMEKFGDMLFNGTYNVKSSVATSIVFPSEGANYVVDTDNDLVYNANRTKLLWFVAGSAKTAITIDDAVTEIGDNIFREAKKLKTITLGPSVAKIGDYAFYNCTALTAMTLPETLTYVGKSAFYKCSKVTTMNIPANLEYIGDQAFADMKLAQLGAVTIKEGAHVGASAFSSCAKMTSLVYNATELSEKAFYGCTGLTSVTLSDSITTLPVSVFSGCSGITSLNIPTSLTTIKEDALYGTSKLKTELVLPSTVTALGDKALRGVGFAKVTIPATVTEMGGNMFESATTTEVVFNNSFETLPMYTFNKSKVATATFPNELKTILPYAFRDATEFKELSFPHVTTIYYGAFYQTTGLTTLNASLATNFPMTYGSSSYVTYGPFYNCTSLSSLTLGSELDTYANSFFYGCSALDVTLSSNVKYIGSYAFRGSGITNFEMSDDMRFKGYASTETGGKILGYQFENATKLKTAKLNSSVTELYYNMFSGCSSLSTLTVEGTLTTINSNALKGTALTALPDISSVTTMGTYAFSGMTKLKEAILPTNASFTSIPENTFNGDTMMEKATIPANITDIERYAFQNCTSLTDVYFKGLNFEFNSTGYRYGIFYKSGVKDFHFEDFTKSDVASTVQSQFTYNKTGLTKNSTVTLKCSDGDISVKIA